MRREQVKAAMADARRFLLVALEALEAHAADTNWMPGSKESGACKRASMDLTRSLARMRRHSP